MQVSFFANICDIETQEISILLSEPLRSLGEYMSQDFGGPMENLWIDVALDSYTIQNRHPYKFRFQKRVSGKSKFGVTDAPDKFNVGHYSIHPSLQDLFEAENKVLYILQLIYDSTIILIEKQKRIPGFDIKRFRYEFNLGVQSLGLNLKTSP